MGVTKRAIGSTRKNSAGSIFRRSRVNLIEGTNVTITMSDDATNDEIDVTIAATGGGGGGSGDVVGPASSTDAVPALFDGTTGKLLKNSTPTGTGNPVLQTSPSLTTPSLGVASATTVNKVTITAPATGSTLTIADGKTFACNDNVTVGTAGLVLGNSGGLTVSASKVLTVSNSLTISGTDASSVAFGTGGTVAYVANKLSAFAATTSAELAGVISDETGSGKLVFDTSPVLVTPALGVAAATSINKITVTAPATGATLTLAEGSSLVTSGANSITLTSSGPTNVTLPTTGTLATLAGTETLSGKTLTAPKFASGGFVADANGNEQIIFTTTAAAVNELTLKNAATGGTPGFSASGDDANVGIGFSAKGTGAYMFAGNSTQAAEIRLYEDTDDGSNYTAFKVGTQAGNVTYTLPTADGSNTYVLQTNGSGVLSWAAPGGGGGAPTTAQYVTLATDATLSAERVLTGTTNQVTITDNGAGSTVVLSLPQSVDTAAAVQFASLGLGTSVASGFQMDVSQPVATSGSPRIARFVGGAHTTLTASTEASDVTFNLNRTVQFSTGALTTQRALYVLAPTYAFVGASTLTTAATFTVSGPPGTGTNATITRKYSIMSESGNVCFQPAAGVGITVDFQGTNSNNAAQTVFFKSGALTSSSASTDFTWNVVNTRTAGLMYEFQRSGTTTLSIGFTGAMTLSPVVITSGVQPVMTVTMPANTNQTASTEINDVYFNLSATKQWAAGALTTQRAFRIAAPTYAFVSASTITTACTFYISGAPAAGTNATITTAYSLWIDAGLPRVDSTTANGSVATVLGSVGPTGSNTTVQEWLTLDINGTTRYIPCF